MKFLRHLAAVVFAVAVIVGLGLLWAHASGSGLRQAPSPQALQRLQQIKAGMIMVRPGNGSSFTDTANLIRTCEIEAALAALVVTVGAIRRRHRRMRRAVAAPAARG